MVLFALWFFLPAGVANMAPVFADKIPALRNWTLPLDFGHKFHGKRIFGDNKTWRGLLLGIVLSTVVLGLQVWAFNHFGWAQDIANNINYFVFPGMTDDVDEYEALRKFIRETDLTMIQWRNFNIDPDWYLDKIGVSETGEPIGMRKMIGLIRDEFPHLAFGYFNPGIEFIRRYLKNQRVSKSHVE